MSYAPISPWTSEAWEQVQLKVMRTSERIGDQFPHASIDGKYGLASPNWWTAGFWPGLLWLLYEGTNEESFRFIAERCEQKLDSVLDEFESLDHDLGFMWTLTSIANYKLSGNAISRRRALKAASHLIGRFNLKGNYIRAWNPWKEGEANDGLAIIDCVMNLPLLFWATNETKDPRFAHIANAHMKTVLSHFIRTDGSVRHIVRFDPHTGEVAEYIGGQGYGPESAWSRGNAWAIYGLALAYHHTHNDEYLDGARRTAQFFLSQLPKDHVPEWDFRAPMETKHLKDSSAGACAACGLLLLSDLVSGDEALEYRTAGEHILESLYRNYSAFDNMMEEGLILHGTGHYPEKGNIDVPLIYGDYFFVEGLARLKGGISISWE